jgi:hypothetical protein
MIFDEVMAHFPGAAIFDRLDHRDLGPGQREDDGHLGRDLST